MSYSINSTRKFRKLFLQETTVLAKSRGENDYFAVNVFRFLKSILEVMDLH